MQLRRSSIVLVAAALLASAPTARAQGLGDLSKYTLTMDVLKQVFAASQSLKAASATDPSIAEILGAGDDEWSQSVAKLQKNSGAMAALKKSGLTAEQYFMAIAAYAGALSVVAVQEVDPSYKAPADINPKNVEFVKAHRAELEKMSGAPSSP